MSRRAPEPSLRPAFVISTGRCGSTLLSELLRAHPQVLSLSEFFSLSGGGRVLALEPLAGSALDSFLKTPQLDLRTPLARGPVHEILASHQLSGEECAALPPLLLTTLPHLVERPALLFAALSAFVRSAPLAPIAAHLEAIFGWLCQELSRALWVERSGGSAEYAPELLRAFPRARAIFLVRDGVASALSMANHPLFRQRVSALVGRDEQTTTDVALSVFGSYWSAAMHKAWSAFVIADDALIVRYEDLIQTPAAELARIARFLQLDPERSRSWLEALPSLPRRAPGRPDAATDQTHQELARSCRPGMRCLSRFLECRT